MLMDWLKDYWAAVMQHSGGFQYLGFIFLVACLKNKASTKAKNPNKQPHKTHPPQLTSKMNLTKQLLNTAAK